jgi:hypothetical protein
VDSYKLYIHLDNDDFIFIREHLDLCESEDGCKIFVTNQTAVDMAGNALEAGSEFASVITPDRVPPRLEAFSADLVTGTLFFTFNEPMNETAFHPVAVRLTNGTAGAGTIVLTGGAASAQNRSMVVVVQVTNSDLAQMQRHLHERMFVVIDAAAFRDRGISGNRVVPVPSGSGIDASSIVYYASATIATVQPTHGAAAGGNTVTITGTNFVQATLQSTSRFFPAPLAVDVYFNGVAATSVTVVSDTVITCVSPAGSAGAADVSVELDHVLWTTAGSVFVFLEAPTVSSVTPRVVSTLGGTRITVAGDKFGPASSASSPPVSVNVDGRACTDVVVASETSLSCNLPVGLAVGFVPVLVDVAGQTFEANSSLEVIGAPVVGRISPEQGYAGESTHVEVTGLNFGPSTASGEGPVVVVTVGGEACENTVVVNESRIECDVTPRVGIRSVVVTVDGASSSEAVTFTDYADAGRFDFEVANVVLSEEVTAVNLTVVRSGQYLPSPATVTVATRDGRATTPVYYTAVQQVLVFDTDVTNVTVTVPITALSRDDAPHKGADDDASFFVDIAAVVAEEGSATIGQSQVEVMIEAVCQVLTDMCVFQLTDQGGDYSRV